MAGLARVLTWKFVGIGNETLRQGDEGHELILFPYKNPHFPPNLFSTNFFSMKMAEFLKRALLVSKLHYQFRQYSTLTKTVLLESQYLQSYDSLPDFLRPNLKKIVITLKILRFKQNYLRQS